MRRIALGLAVLAALLAAAGCGGSKKSSSPPTAPSVTVTVKATTPATTTTASSGTGTGTGTGSGGGTGLTGNCVQFASAQAKIAQAVGLAASHGDTSAVKAYFATIAGKVPSDIKPSFQVVADTVTKYLDLLKTINFKPGQTPNPADIAKAQKAAAALETPTFKQASAKVEAWVKGGCH